MTRDVTFNELIVLVQLWAEEKGINNSDPKSQMLKVVEEVGEVAGAIAKNKKSDLVDGIGDSFVTLIILCQQLDLDPAFCLSVAYNEIKGRTGKNIDGVFVKDTDS